MVRSVQRAEPDESLGVFDSPITDAIAITTLGSGRSWLLLREVLRGAVMGVRAEAATGRDEAIIARFGSLATSPGDLLDFHAGYMLGLGKGLISPITDVFDLLKLGLDVQRSATTWLLTQGATLIANFKQRSPGAVALLDQLDLVARKAGKVLTRALILLSNPLTAMLLVNALLDKLAQAALGAARAAGRRIVLSIFEFLELPWRQFGEQIGFVVGTVLVEFLMGVLTSGVGNIVRNVVRLMGRGGRLVASHAIQVFRLLRGLPGELLIMLRRLPEGLVGDLAPDMEHLVKLAEPLFDDVAATLAKDPIPADTPLPNVGLPDVPASTGGVPSGGAVSQGLPVGPGKVEPKVGSVETPGAATGQDPVPTAATHPRTQDDEYADFLQWIKQEGGTADVRAAGEPFTMQPHGGARQARQTVGVSGQSHQSAHGLPRSVGRGMPGYDPRAALTTLEQTGIHTGMDAYWKAEFQAMRRSGRTTATAQEIYNTVAESIQRAPGLSQTYKDALKLRLQDEMFVEFGLNSADVLPLPYPNILP
jgi:hypothetical protein